MRYALGGDGGLDRVHHGGGRQIVAEVTAAGGHKGDQTGNEQEHGECANDCVFHDRFLSLAGVGTYLVQAWVRIYCKTIS